MVSLLKYMQTFETYMTAEILEKYRLNYMLVK